jgi:DNA-directed RNA polymerase subunit RPC12/RpoP
MVLSDWRPPAGYVPAPSAVDGVRVFAPAPPEQEQLPEVFHCDRCGHDTKFAPGTEALVCEACESRQAITDVVVAKPEEGRAEFRVETLERAARGWGSSRKEIVCEQCGATVVVAADALVNECTFCLSRRVLAQGATQEALRPVAVLPFTATDAAARERVRGWLSAGQERAWWGGPRGFRPRTLPRAIDSLRMHGVYLPFWIFDATVDVAWTAEVGKRVKRGDKYVTKWERKSGRVSRHKSGDLEDGVPDLDAELLEGLRPWGLADLKDYTPEFLAGWQARAATVPLETAWASVRERWRADGNQAGYQAINASRVRNYQADISYRDERWRYVLLPAHVGMYEHGGERFPVMLNGASAELCGRRPLDRQAFARFAAAVLSPGLLVMLVDLVFRLITGAWILLRAGDGVASLHGLGMFWIFLAVVYVGHRYGKLTREIGEAS